MLRGLITVNPETLYSLGITFIFVGVAILLVAFLLLFFSSVKKEKEQKIRGGGAIIIGPIPIIFGTDKNSVKTLLLLSITLTILLIVLIVVLNIV